MSTRVFVAATLAAAAMIPVTASAQPNDVNQNPNVYPPPPGAIPEANQPLIQPERLQPTYSIEGGAGILGFVSGAAGIGPAWSARASMNLTPRFAIEANYNGAVNKRPLTDTTLVSTLLDADVRYNLTLPDQAPVQPYLTAGAGYGGFAGDGGDGATLIIPVSAGVERALTRNIKIGARFTFRPAFFDDLGTTVATGLPTLPAVPSANRPGADTYELVANVGGAF